MKKQYVSLLALLLSLVLLLGGCGSKMNGGVATDRFDEYYDEEMDMGVTEDSAEAPAERKVIITAEYSLETTNMAASIDKLEKLVAGAKGYVQSSECDGNDEEDGSATYVLRIPSDKVSSLTQSLEQVGRVTHSSQTSNDITNEYYDVDARRKAKEAHRDRILELLKMASSLDELLQLEKELADVQGELDSLTGLLKRYDQQVAYSTITVRLWQNSLVADTGDSYGSRLMRELKNSFGAALDVVEGLGVVFVWLLPYILVAGVVVVIVLLATRKQRKARKAMRQAAKTVYTPPAPPQNSQNGQ